MSRKKVNDALNNNDDEETILSIEGQLEFYRIQGRVYVRCTQQAAKAYYAKMAEQGLFPCYTKHTSGRIAVSLTRR